jgi:hypothetical protein
MIDDRIDHAVNLDQAISNAIRAITATHTLVSKDYFGSGFRFYGGGGFLKRLDVALFFHK